MKTLVLSAGLVALAAPAVAGDIFKERILPIFNSPEPASCVECHLSGVDLKNYILPTEAQTFANLRDLGLINLDTPADSKILEFIAMKPEGESYAKRIDPKVREAEFAAFSTWVRRAAADPKLRNAPAIEPDKRATPEFPVEVIRHARIDSLLDSFERNIWALRFRCASCHDPNGPKFEKHAKEHGADVMAWLKAEGPAESMRYLMTSDLLDLEDPKNSELLLKPLDISDHGGGEKMRLNDTDYVAFLAWIQDYANIVTGAYASDEDLPNGPELNGSEIWLRVVGLPERRVGSTALLALHRATDRPGGWSEEPVAISSGTIIKNPRFGVMLNTFLMLRDKHISAGRYQVRLYIDEDERTELDFSKAIEQAKFVGATVVESQWKGGFKNSTAVQAQRFAH